MALLTSPFIVNWSTHSFLHFQDSYASCYDRTHRKPGPTNGCDECAARIGTQELNPNRPRCLVINYQRTPKLYLDSAPFLPKREISRQLHFAVMLYSLQICTPRLSFIVKQKGQQI
uniref:Uncharacterized protein n=1 Tax=Schistocephalus solidus TaxID=70667 RepID=A0A0X3PJ64_SCHSO